jgi:hypothetical protein
VPTEALPPVPLLVDEEELLSSRSNRLVPLEVEDVDVELEEEEEELTPPPKVPELVEEDVELVEEVEELLELDVHTSTPLSNPYEGPTSLVHLRPG